MIILMYLLIGMIMAGMLCLLLEKKAVAPYFLLITLTWLPLFVTGTWLLSLDWQNLVRID